MKKPLLNKRRAARFAAVQALYQIELNNAEPLDVVREFSEHRLSKLLEPLGQEPSPEVDRDMFQRVVIGTTEAIAELDPLIAARLGQGWSLARCGFMLRACLRAASFELAKCTDIPVGVVINEYIDLAKLFLPGNEASLVNAVLDGIASELRPKEGAA
ncbi:NusB antitermination factor [Arboricoccus pini]|uniref:Transcription antitermination protein NusB n=1 Tax=Arboricoccus pini TaxID=1963835 RepID=A0A212R2U1_9PROT|nr:transcription antitermination factor NusB [Arboricoccus pini]SNB66329.1 NusB antitermination factor [Arboricoccus pini]